MSENAKVDSRRQGPPIPNAKPAAAVALREQVGADQPISTIELIMCAIVAAIMFVSIYMVPRPIGDLYVAFAGAQDILNGKLGKLDDWSFANNQIWVNQNWGTHLLYYGAYAAGGPTGILVLKAAILLLMGIGVFLAIRQHKVSLPVAILISGSVMIAGNAYLDLRPNLISLTFCPIFYWLLLRTRPQPHRIWLAVAFLWLWANMHGGFIFGYALMGLWCALRLVEASMTPQIPAGVKLLAYLFFPIAVPLRLVQALVKKEGWIKKAWPYVVAPVVGFALIAFANPFGFENITHPFVVGGSKAWRQVAEWFPVFNTEEIGYGSRFEFFLAVSIIAVLAFIRPLLKTIVPRVFGKVSVGDAILSGFGLALCGLVIALGIPAHQELQSRASKLQSGYDAFVESLSRQPNMSMEERLSQRESYKRWMQRELGSVERLISGTIWPLVIFSLLCVGGVCAVVMVLAKLLSGVSDRDTTGPPAFGLDMATLLFALTLGGIVVYMGFGARRFVPLAIIMMAPLLAMHLDWLFMQLHALRPLPVVLAAGALVIPVSMLTARNYKHYQAANPLYSKEFSSVYDRMIFNNAYGHGAAEFINQNHIAGNVIQEWRWEGFLHWKCPQLKLYVGGRAQQAYDEDTYLHRQDLLSGVDHITGKPLDRIQGLRALNIRFVVMPMGDNNNFVGTLMSKSSPWTVLYADNDLNIVLGDTSDPNVAALADKVIAGQLWYPDPGIAALSQALCMSRRTTLSPEKRRDALAAACLKMPNLLAYSSFMDMANAGEVPLVWVADFYRKEYNRLAPLAKETTDPHVAFELTELRRQLAYLLLAQITGRLPVALQMSEDEYFALKNEYDELDRTINDIRKRWQ